MRRTVSGATWHLDQGWMACPRNFGIPLTERPTPTAALHRSNCIKDRIASRGLLRGSPEACAPQCLASPVVRLQAPLQACASWGSASGLRSALSADRLSFVYVPVQRSSPGSSLAVLSPPYLAQMTDLLWA